MTSLNPLPTIDQSPLQRIVTGALFFLCTLTIAVVGYLAAGWSLMDAMYMTIITVFGVGYAEVGQMTPPLRIFTMFVIIAGTSSAVYTVGGFFQAIAEGEMQRILGARRMTREIDGLEGHVIICGLGRMGRMLARRLSDAGQSFVAIDIDPERILRALEAGYLVYEGDATDEAVLKRVGIQRAKALATALPDDATNVFITLTARGMKPDLNIIARGEYPSTEKKLRLAGADHVVLPAMIGAQRMAHIINHPSALTFLEEDSGRSALSEMLSRLDIKLDEVEVAAASPLIGRTIGDVEVRGKGTFIVVALLRHSGETIIHPIQTTPLLIGDTLIVMGHTDDMPQFSHSRVWSYAPRRWGVRR